MGNDPTPRPGFDYWVAIPGQGRTTDPELYEDGRLHTVPGYITDVLTYRAVDFTEQERDQPFLLYLAHKAVHPDAVQLDDGSVDLTVPSRYMPAPRHRGRYEDAVFPPRPNLVSGPEKLVGKPALQRALRKKTSPEMLDEFGEEWLDLGSSYETLVRRSEMVLPVDESLGRIVEALRLDPASPGGGALRPGAGSLRDEQPHRRSGHGWRDRGPSRPDADGGSGGTGAAWLLSAILEDRQHSNERKP